MGSFPSSASISLGALTPWSTQGDYNVQLFAIQRALSRMQTATLVQVQTCTNSGAVAPVGTVDVLPLVNQVDGDGNGMPHTTVFGLPYLRLGAGSNGVIIDPQAGDIGVAVFASRDISKVVATQAAGNPGSGRQYDYADGIYLGTVLSANAPTQYLQFQASGITLKSPENIILSGDSIQAGGSPVPVVLQPLITWVTATLIPALATAGITVSAPPANALSTTFEAS